MWPWLLVAALVLGRPVLLLFAHFIALLSVRVRPLRLWIEKDVDPSLREVGGYYQQILGALGFKFAGAFRQGGSVSLVPDEQVEESGLAFEHPDGTWALLSMGLAPVPYLPLALSLVSVQSGRRFAITTYGRGDVDHRILAHVEIADVVSGTVAELLQAHRARCPSSERTTLEALCRDLERNSAEEIGILEAKGWIRVDPQRPDAHRITPSGARRFAPNVLTQNKAMGRLVALRRAAVSKGLEPPPPPLSDGLLAQLFLRTASLNERVNVGLTWVVLLITEAVLAWFLEWGALAVGLGTGSALLGAHAGGALGWRLVGRPIRPGWTGLYRGMTEVPEGAGTRQLIVATLAAMLGAWAAAAAWFAAGEAESGWLCAFMAFMLCAPLPLPGFPGDRLLRLLLLGRAPIFEGLLGVGFGAATLAVTAYTGFWALAITGAFGVWMSWRGIRTSRWAQRLARRDPEVLRQPPLEQVKAILQTMGPQPNMQWPQRVEAITEVMKKLHARPPGLAATVAGLAAYGLVLTSAVVGSATQWSHFVPGDVELDWNDVVVLGPELPAPQRWDRSDSPEHEVAAGAWVRVNSEEGIEALHSAADRGWRSDEHAWVEKHVRRDAEAFEADPQIYFETMRAAASDLETALSGIEGVDVVTSVGFESDAGLGLLCIHSEPRPVELQDLMDRAGLADGRWPWEAGFRTDAEARAARHTVAELMRTRNEAATDSFRFNAWDTLWMAFAPQLGANDLMDRALEREAEMRRALQDRIDVGDLDRQAAVVFMQAQEAVWEAQRRSLQRVELLRAGEASEALEEDRGLNASQAMRSSLLALYEPDDGSGLESDRWKSFHSEEADGGLRIQAQHVETGMDADALDHLLAHCSQVRVQKTTWSSDPMDL